MYLNGAGFILRQTTPNLRLPCERGNSDYPPPRLQVKKVQGVVRKNEEAAVPATGKAD
jgi:hypothetical protein